MELKKAEVYFKLAGNLEGLSRIDHGYGIKAGAINNGTPYKKATFNVSLGENEKHRVQIFGMTKEKVYYFDEKEKKTGFVDWEQRDSLRENKDYRVYPIQYDEVTKLEFAEDGECYFVSGTVGVTTNDDGNLFYDLNGDYVNEQTSENRLNSISGTFIFNETSKDGGLWIHGFVVNYKEEVYPIKFLWKGTEEEFDKFSNACVFGKTCSIKEGSIDFISSTKVKENTDKDDEQVFGNHQEQVLFVKRVFAITSVGIRKDDPYDRDFLFGKAKFKKSEDDIF